MLCGRSLNAAGGTRGWTRRQSDCRKSGGQQPDLSGIHPQEPQPRVYGQIGILLPVRNQCGKATQGDQGVRLLEIKMDVRIAVGSIIVFTVSSSVVKAQDLNPVNPETGIYGKGTLSECRASLRSQASPGQEHHTFNQNQLKPYQQNHTGRSTPSPEVKRHQKKP